jgi:hypothetical protein
MGKLLLPLYLCLLATPSHGLADVIDLANSLRTTGCGDRPAIDTPLSRNALLNTAAGRVAAGEALQSASYEAGYTAKRVARIHVSNASGVELSQLLEAEFCAILADPEFSDIGVHLTGKETWLLLAAPLSLDVGESTESAADRLFIGINHARSRERVCSVADKFAAAAPLRRSAELDAAAMQHAVDIAARGELGHYGSDGSTAAERASRAGYDWQTVGENVAAGQSGADEVVDTWLASPGHCRNLMNGRYTETGIAVALNDRDNRVIYWVQVYAAPK